MGKHGQQHRLKTWSNSLEKKHKTQNIGKIVKTRSPLLARHGHLWTKKKGPKTVIFSNALFFHFPWDLPTFSAESSITNAQKRLFLGPKSYSKGPNHALEKVLTSETPCILEQKKTKEQEVWMILGRHMETLEPAERQLEASLAVDPRAATPKDNFSGTGDKTH